MKYRCGVVGLGRGRQFVKAFNANQHCEMIAVCDPSPRTLEPFQGVKTHTEFEAFLDENLDVVAIISPGPVHAEQSLAALERGAHVLCETPCVYSIDEAKRVVEAVRRTGRKYMLAENYIWQGWCQTLLRMADEGKFGDIVYSEGDYTHDIRDLMLADEEGFVPYAQRAERPGAKKTWRATHLPPIQYCSHTLGPLMRLAGSSATYAFGLSVRGRAAPDLVDTDIESALFETKRDDGSNGAIFRLTNGFSVAHPMALYYNIVGTRGSAKILKAGGDVAKWWSETGGEMKGWQEMPADYEKRPDGRSDLQAMLDDCIDSVVNDAKPPIDVYESMDMTLPGIIAHQSGLSGGVKLEIPDPRCMQYR